MVESSSDDILKDADKVDVAFLVVGDPFGYAYPDINIFNPVSNVYIEQQLIATSSSAPASSPSPRALSPTPVF
jgi:diphthamide biosynthesis methyltransferase